MDSNYRDDLLRCIELIKEHIAKNDSFILAKTKAMRHLFLNRDDALILQGMTEYLEIKNKYLKQHTNDRKWNKT